MGGKLNRRRHAICLTCSLDSAAQRRRKRKAPAFWASGALRTEGGVSGRISQTKILFLCMLLAMSFRCLFGMVPGMKGMSSGRVSVVCRLLMVSAFMMLRCFPVVMGGVGMMLRRFLVVFRSFLRHLVSSSIGLLVR
jgi:hypothetical protein